MEELLISIGFFKEDIDSILNVCDDINEYKISRVILLLKKYKCDNNFIREIILNKKNIFEMDLDKLEFSLEAIVSNGDTVEEILGELI